MKSISIKSVIGLCIIMLYCGCTKQASDEFVSSSQASNISKKDMVITPFGYMNKSQVHFVGEGYSVSIINNRLKKVEEKTGKIIEDFGPAGPNNQLTGLALKNAPSVLPALASGWITYAYWYNDTTKPVTYFSTDWVVPSNPLTNSGQTIFLFNGMQDGFAFNSHILQPVLQWGSSAAGGSFDWEITNWYVSSNQAFYGALVKVATGTKLQGIMRVTAKNGYKYDYVSYFKGYPKASGLRVQNAKQLFWAAETLETYGVQKNSDYPNDKNIRMDSIQFLQAQKNASLNWTAVNQTGVPQHTAIVSNNSPGGEVDIYFK